MLATSSKYSLMRTQKDSEGESTEDSLSVANDMSSEISYLMGSARGVCMLEGNISRRDMASCERSPGVARPLALYMMSSKQPVRPCGSCSDHDTPVMPDRVCSTSLISKDGKRPSGSRMAE